MKLKTQTNRAIDILEACGWTAGIVERKVSRIVAMDLFGFADIVAVNPGVESGILFLQVTDDGNLSTRVKKIMQEPRAITCLQTGARVEAWGIRDKPDLQGSILLARSFVWDDQQLRVVKGSLIVEA